MKKIIIIALGLMLSTASLACDDKKGAAPAAKAAAPAAKAAPAAAQPAAEPNKTDTAGQGEIREVCKDKVDNFGKPVKDKAGNPVQECKKVKVRKKLEATEIPPAKK